MLQTGANVGEAGQEQASGHRPPPRDEPRKLARRGPKAGQILSILPVDFAWQIPCQPLHRWQGVPAQCVGAPLRASWKSWWLGPYSFWTSCGIYLKGSEADRIFSLSVKAFRRFPEVRPVRDCRCRGLRVKEPGLMSRACTDGEDRFGAESPATGSNLESPVRRRPCVGGRIVLRSVVLPGFVQSLRNARVGRLVATGGSRI